MRAKALRTWAQTPQARHLRMDVYVHQTLEVTSRIYRFGVWLYNFIQKTLPVLHQIYFRFLEWLGPLRSRKFIRGAAGFMEVVRETSPDVVLSTHPHLNHGFMDLARAAMPGRPPVCVTYCGELHHTFGFSRYWVNPEMDLFIGAVKETCQAAAHYGMPSHRIWHGGFLLKPDFYLPRIDREERAHYLRDYLRLDPDQFILVLATGANGANNHLRFLRALDRAGVRPQVVAMCGREARIQMEVLQWAAEHPAWTVRALGYFSEVHLLLQCADAVVARPGTGTTSEAILCGCPVIFNVIGGAMPQEMITVRYFRTHNWPRPVGRAGSLPNRVRYWMNHPQHLAQARQVMQQVLPEGKPLQLLQRLHQLARANRESPSREPRREAVTT